MRTVLVAGALLAGLLGGLLVQHRPGRPRALSTRRCARSGRPARPARPRGACASIVAASGASFADVLSRLRAGRAYAARAFRSRRAAVVRGRTASRQRGRGARRLHARHARWPLRVSLHGGVGRPAPAAGRRAAASAHQPDPGGGEIVLHPRSWAEHRVVEAGCRSTTSCARRSAEAPLQRRRVAHLPHRHLRRRHRRLLLRACARRRRGPPACRSTATRACWPIPTSAPTASSSPRNLANCPLHIVNGGRDRLYPAASVAPLIEMFKKGGMPARRGRCYPGGRPRRQLVARGAAALRGVSRRAPARGPSRHRCRGRPSAPIATTASAGW